MNWIVIVIMIFLSFLFGFVIGVAYGQEDKNL